MVDSVDFEPYLRSLTHHYAQWWSLYAFMDEIDDLTWFEFELTSKTQEKPTEPGGKPKEKTQLVLKAIEDYAHEKILIVGSPGAGKSTLLARILWQAAERVQQDETAPIPVLVELKLYPELDIWERIQTTLENCDLYLEILEIKQLVKDKRLLLLADGFNELPTDGARAEFKKFCGRNIPVIVTSRDAVDSLGLERKLELQPPSDQQVARFLEERLPDSDRTQFQKLGDRVKDLGQTPLMIWMLYSIFRAKPDETPETRGEVYRTFTAIYAERAKEGVDLTESRFILSKLAFEMMRSLKLDDPKDFRPPDISEVDAQNLLGSEKVLKHLVNNHLLQWQGKPRNRKISFCHQSLQEYYAAEWLLREVEQHPEWLEKMPDQKYTQFQWKYLNYLKWMQPIALMLGLADEDLAMRVVELAIGVDLMLGARLAGEVQREFQQGTIGLIKNLEGIHYHLKIKFMGRTRSEEALSFLVAALKNEDFEIRGQGTAALKELRCTSAIPVLYQALEDNYFQVRWQAVAALEDLGNTDAILTLFQALQNENPHIRMRACESLAAVGSAKAIPVLRQALQDEDSSVRGKAVYALGSLGSVEALPALCQVLQDDDSFVVRDSAAHTLGNLGNAEAIPALSEALQDDEESEVRGRAAESLGRLGSPKVILALLKALQDDEEYEVRERAASALGDLGSTEAIPALLKALQHEDFNVRNLAAYALSSLGCIEATPTLFQTLQDKDDFTRGNAAYALGNIGSVEAIPALLEALQDDEFSMRSSAALALGNIGGVEAIPALLKALQYDEFFVRDSAAHALGNLGNTKAIPALLEALQDENSSVRWNAAEALGEIAASETLITLWQNYRVTAESYMQDAIASIQARCQFYNYEIYQSPPELEAMPRPSVQPTSSIQYDINAEVVQIIEGNPGEVIGKRDHKAV